MYDKKVLSKSVALSI